MTIAFRSHLDTHEMTAQRIGAGLVRHTCTICDHIAVSTIDEPTVGAAVIPTWMAAAAERFAGIEMDFVHAA